MFLELYWGWRFEGTKEEYMSTDGNIELVF